MLLPGSLPYVASRPKAPLRPAPEPVQVNTVSVLVVGTAVWFVAWCGLLLAHDWLADTGRRSWLWTAFAGWALGPVGIAVVRLQNRKR